MSVYDVGDLIFNGYDKTGRLPCDGSAVRKGTYPDLANISVDFQYEPLFPSIIPGTPEMPGSGNSVLVDGDFVYLAGNSYIAKVRKSDWTIVDEVLGFNSTIQGIAVDETHIYAIGGGSPNFHKIKKSDLSSETHGLSFSNPRAIYVVDNHIHVTHSTNALTHNYSVYDKDTLALVGGDYRPNIARVIFPYKGFVYLEVTPDNCVSAIDKEDLSVVSTSQSMPGVIEDLFVEEEYIYVAHRSRPGLTVLNRSDLSVAHTLDTGGAGYSVYVDDFHIYLGSGANDEIHIFKKSEWSHVVSIPVEGRYFYDIYVDEDYIFAAHGGNGRNFTALSKRDTVAEGFFRVPEIPRNPKYPNIPVLVQAYDKWPPWPRDLLVKGQSLVYDFVNQVYVVSHQDNTIDYTSNVNDLGIVTRASTATYWGPDGTLLEAAVDKARIQHDPVTGEALGLLVESGASNRITASNEVEWLTYQPTSTTLRMDSVGHALGVPISVLECVAPGTVRAATSSNYSNGLVPATISVLAKAEGGGRIILAFSRASLNTGIYFDPATEEFELIGGDRITDYGFERLRDGFYRIWATRRPGPSAGAAGWVHYTIGLTDADVGDRLLVTLLGSADDPAPSSPIPTSGSSVTRAADNAQIDLSDVLNPDEGTYVVRAVVKDDGETEYYAGHYNSGPTSPRISMIRDSDGRFRLQVGSSYRVFDPPSTLKSGDVVTLAASYVVGEEETTYTMSSSGNVSSGTSNYIPENTVNLVRGVGPSLGSNNASLESSGIIAGFEYYPRALTEEELARITAFTSGDNS